MPSRPILLACAVLLLTLQGARAQAPLSLDSCTERAYRQFELQRQIDASVQATQAQLDRLDKTYLPTLDLQAMSTYQNTQIEIPIGIQIPGFTPPAAPLNLNSAMLTIRQWIYDGSQSHHERLIEQASGTAQVLEIETKRLEIRTQVLQLFTAVLLADQHRLILLNKRNVLGERLEEIRAAVRNHVVLQSDADLLQAEVVRLEQQIDELRFTRQQYVRSLGRLTGTELADTVVLETPAAAVTGVTTFDERPDLRLIDQRVSEIEARKGLIGSAYLPRIGVFGDAGLGYPGYNIFDTDPAPMAKVGLTLNWHLFDWGKGSAQEQALDLQQQVLAIRKRQLTTQVSAQADAQRTAIEKAEALMRSDADLVRLYTSVADSYASRLRNGTITSSEYLTQLDRQQTAQADLELHKLQRLIATLNYNIMLGQ